MGPTPCEEKSQVKEALPPPVHGHKVNRTHGLTPTLHTQRFQRTAAAAALVVPLPVVHWLSLPAW